MKQQKKEVHQQICDLQEGSSQTIGAKYTCHLDSDRTFYVLETSGDNVSLIMDRNFTDDTVSKTLAWCIDGGSNNTTCKNINSKEEGTPLKHIQDTFGNKVVVSFPTAIQLVTASGGVSSDLAPSVSLLTWLYDYLNGTTNSVSGIKGYWTSTPNTSYTNFAWTGDYDGVLTTATLSIIQVSTAFAQL